MLGNNDDGGSSHSGYQRTRLEVEGMDPKLRHVGIAVRLFVRRGPRWRYSATTATHTHDAVGARMVSAWKQKQPLERRPTLHDRIVCACFGVLRVDSLIARHSDFPLCLQ
jgi:hypothetical protein